MGKPLAQITQKCTCDCHTSEGMIMHMMSCCDKDGNETVEIPLSVTDYFHMTYDEIITRFSDVLTDEEKKELKKYDSSS